MNEKLELLNAIQAELEGLGMRVGAISVNVRRTFTGEDVAETDVHCVTMPCQSGCYHAEWVQRGRDSYDVQIIREIPAKIRTLNATLREDLLRENVRHVDGPTLKRLFIEAVTRFSAPHFQDFALVCADWPSAKPVAG
jgi:hypothetical protein